MPCGTFWQNLLNLCQIWPPIRVWTIPLKRKRTLVHFWEARVNKVFVSLLHCIYMLSKHSVIDFCCVIKCLGFFFWKKYTILHLIMHGFFYSYINKLGRYHFNKWYDITLIGVTLTLKIPKNPKWAVCYLGILI
jgi:hypothetical protein